MYEKHLLKKCEVVSFTSAILRIDVVPYEKYILRRTYDHTFDLINHVLC